MGPGNISFAMKIHLALITALLLSTLSCPAAHPAMHARQVQAPAAGGAYHPSTAYFVGTTATWIRRDAALWSDGNTFYASFWIKPDNGSSGTGDRILASNGDGVRITLNSSDVIQFTCEASDGTTLLVDASSQPTVTRNGSTWSHVLIRLDRTVDNQIDVFVDGSEGTGTTISTFLSTGENALPINLDETSWAVASDFGFGFEYGGCIADLWVSSGNTFANITIGDFYSGGAPVNLGATGTGPDGSQPAIFLNGANTSFITNAGSGGNFTKQGATDLTDCSTAP